LRCAGLNASEGEKKKKRRERLWCVQYCNTKKRKEGGFNMHRSVNRRQERRRGGGGGGGPSLLKWEEGEKWGAKLNPPEKSTVPLKADSE